MASPDLPPPPLKHKDDEQGSVGSPPANTTGTESKLENCQGTGRKCEIGNGETANSSPPFRNNTDATNKRKREPDAAVDDDEEKISPDVTPVTDTRETQVTAVQSTGVKEIEMKDAEAIDGPSDQGIKEIEMQDAEVVYNRTTRVEEKSGEDSVADVHEERKVHPESNLKGNEGCKQDEGTKETEQPAKNEEFERNEKQSIPVDTKDGSGQQALGEVATLLKQVQESDVKAKVEVEVKVKKMDDGVVNENGGTEKSQSVAQVGGCA